MAKKPAKAGIHGDYLRSERRWGQVWSPHGWEESPHLVNEAEARDEVPAL